MSIRFQILCSSKQSINGKKVISQIGGRNPLGEVWSLRLEQAISEIQSGQWEFFINAKGKSYPINLIESPTGLILFSDDNGVNLLLNLPDCPE